MERRPHSTVAREQFLYVEEAKWHLNPSVSAVQLERKNISMLSPPSEEAEATSPQEATPTAAAPAATTEEATITIVGRKPPLGDESPTIILTKTIDNTIVPEPQNGETETTCEDSASSLSTGDIDTKKEKPSSRLTVQFSVLPHKRDSTHVMEFFQEQEKSLQESFMSFPKQTKKHRSPSPGMLQSAGLEHLDNLVRLMEQLTSLKDENSRLRKRCDYLESTKILLQAKQELVPDDGAVPKGYRTLPAKHKTKTKKSHSNSKQYDHRERIPSAEDEEYLELVDSSSDQRPKRPKAAMHKRSFSTGSLEVPSEFLEGTESLDVHKHIKTKPGKSFFGGKSSGTKQKTKSSKWARVKKVLTGQKLYEDLGTTIRSLRELGRTSHLRYPSLVTPHDMSPPSPRMITESQSSVDTSQVSRGVSQQQSMVVEEELGTEIWMGPEEWWEQYEARKGSCASTNSDVSSVIEVTTMYLGSKEKDTQRHLRVKSLTRRQSSPSLSIKEGEDDFNVTNSTSSQFVHRSSSCKSGDLDLPTKEELGTSKVSEGRESKKVHRTAWGRVKDIIHTRKDSMKKKPKRDRGDLEISQSEETSEADMEALMEEHWGSDIFGEGVMSMSTPKTSPIVIRQHSSKSFSESPPGMGIKGSPVKPSMAAAGSPGGVDVATLLAGSVSDEFSKKMQEWEELKSRKSTSSFKASVVEESEGDEPSQELVPRSQDSIESKTKGVESPSEGVTPDDSSASLELIGGQGINVEEMQRRMTESFSRKLQEWERLKYKGSPVPGGYRDPSPDMERKGSRGRKDFRQKSKRTREEKEKEKLEKQREREMLKVEREQVKLEKEKMRIEKERLRALEREAKLEKLKGRLSQSDVETTLKNPVLSPLAEYKVTADFARKLHEWELRKGLSHDISTAIYLEAQKKSIQHGEEGQLEGALGKQELEEGGEGGKMAPPPLALRACWDSPEDTSPVEKVSEVSLGEDSSVTEQSLTKSNISSVLAFYGSLERANSQLLEELQRKEMEYAAVQDEVNKLNERLAKVREEHAAEMARFHRELASGSLTSPVKLEVGQLESTMGELEEKIHQMESFGERLAQSMESAAIGKWQSIEGEETVHTQLVELVEQMRNMLVQATQSEEQSQKVMALTNFEKLYSHAMKLQIQMNNLRLSHLERNKEIMTIKRQLLLQEVNNLLLQADITRREIELYQYQETKRFSALKRWKTFSGSERTARPLIETRTERSSFHQSGLKETGRVTSKSSDARKDIPYISEETVKSCAKQSSLSAPSSPSTASTTPRDIPHSSPGLRLEAITERATDHVESHLLTPSFQQQDHTIHRQSDQQASAPGSSIMLHLPSAKVSLPKGTPASPQMRKTSPSPLPASHPLKSAPNNQQALSVQSSSQVMEVDSKLPIQEPQVTSTSDTAMSTQAHSLPAMVSQYDSAPLHHEIQKLREAKGKMEKGSPILLWPKEITVPVPSPGLERHRGTTETPTLPIPERQHSLEKPRLTKAAPIVDDDYSPALPVMECTESSEISMAAFGAVGGSPPSSPLLDSQRTHYVGEQDTTGKPPRSPVSRHKLKRHREERDNKTKDSGAASPKGSPVPSTRRKPPLPRQSTPVRQSPTASPVAEKAPRSKSLGDMDRSVPDSPSNGRKPLQDVISKFEKRATVCETEERPIQLRKTPSPTLHLPRVGLVTRVKRLKPAIELLEESQRYRSGQSIYTTRILQRYLPQQETKPELTKGPNKENISGKYVQAMVQRLSRETTPVRSGGSSKTNSELSLQRTDSPRAQSEFVSNIVRKLSSPNGQDVHKGPAPLKDLTNDGQVKKLAHTFIEHQGSPEMTQVDSDVGQASKAEHHKSCEIMTSSSEPVSESSYQIMSTSLGSALPKDSQKPDSTIGPTNHRSLPFLGSSSQHEEEEVIPRGRAATYHATSDPRRSPGKDDSMHGFSHEAGSSSTSGRQSPSFAVSPKGKKSGKSKEWRAELCRLPSPHSPETRGARKSKMETVGVLCKQSISFDLGVSLYSSQEASLRQEESSVIPKSRKPRSWDPSESAKAEAEAAAEAAASTSSDTRPKSTSSEGEVAPTSPREKKKPRRFLDSSWLQKPKKFFKVSK